MKRFQFLAFLVVVFSSPASYAQTVTATVYDSWYDGRVTFCNGVYRHWQVSAAHPWLSCGTKVNVRHGNQTLLVEITDRCDCNSIDLSAGAAYRLGVPLDGTASVRISY